MSIKRIGLAVIVTISLTSCIGKMKEEGVLLEGNSLNGTQEMELPSRTQVENENLVAESTATRDYVALTETNAFSDSRPGYLSEAWTVFTLSQLESALPNKTIGTFEIYDIEEANNGVMWFATTYGLVSFNGKTWQLVAEDNQIVARAFVEIGDDNSVWFTLSRGIYVYRDGEIYTWPEMADLGVQNVEALEIAPNGSVWIAYHNGEIRVCEDGIWREITINGVTQIAQINDLEIDSNGEIYLSWNASTYTGGIAQLSNDEWFVFTNDDISGKGFNQPFIVDPLAVDSQNRVWFYSWREGLYQYADGKFFLLAPHDQEILFGYHPVVISINSDDTVWLGATDPGIPLAVFMPNGRQIQAIDGSFEFYLFEDDYEHPFIRYQSEGILPFERVSALRIDSQNTLWIATDYGLYLFDLDYIGR